MAIKSKDRIKPDTFSVAVFVMICILMVTRIFLLKVIKNEGLGIFASPMDLFMVCYGVFVFAIERAISAVIKLYEKKKQFINAMDVARKARTIGFAAGVIVSGIILIFSFSVSEKLFGSRIGFLAFIATSAAIIFISCQGAIRGMLEGFGENLLSLISDLIFAISFVVLTPAFASFSYRYGLKANALLERNDLASGYGACGALAGGCAASLITLIYLLIIWKIKSGKMDDIVRSGEPRYLGIGPSYGRNIVAYSIVFAFPFAIDIIDEAMYVGSLKHTTAQWGSWFGGVLPVIVIAVCIVTITQLRKVYELCSMVVHSDKHGALDTLSEFSRYLVIILFPVSMFMAVLSDTIQRAVYVTPSDSAVAMMGHASLIVFAAPVGILMSTILLRLRKVRALILNIIVAVIVHAGTFAIMTYVMNKEMTAVSYADFVMFLVMGGMGFWEIMRMLHYRHSWISYFVVPLICSAVAALIVFFLNMVLINVIGEILTILVGCLAGGFLYLLFLLILRGIYEYEVERIPGGGFVLVIARGFHFI